MIRSCSTVLAFVACFAAVLSFNLDVKNPFIYEGSSGEYFGYTVALHAQQNGGNWVVVGAPLGNRTSPTRERERYGSVYKCTTDSTKRCEVIKIDDREPAKTSWQGKEVNREEKSGQWLGATVISTSRPPHFGKLLVCAPRYTLRGVVRDDEQPENRKRLLLGKCYDVWNDLSFSPRSIQPCFHNPDGVGGDYLENKDGVCEAGFSAAMSKDGEAALLGTPGRFAVTGSVAIYVYETREMPRSSKNQVPDSFSSAGNAMGYAVAIGNFKSPDKKEFIASSTRAENLHGKVMAFELDDYNLMSVSFTLPLPKNLQMGSNFGQALCAVDLNNDRYSDLLVGAPYHRHGKGEGDEGRVYVYINNGQSPGTLNHVESMSLDGKKTKGSLFGYAMAVAGDLNRDGFPDVAISAPYGGKDQGGVVFIYFGTKDGIETFYRQAIEASDVFPGVKTFGFSLSGDLDVDNNNYPDLAVGAYSSDKAFLLRARPIVEMDGKIILSTKQISLEDNKTMRLASDRISRKSINVTVCLKYENQKQNSDVRNVTFTVELDNDRLTDEHDLRRMFFFQDNKTSFSITRQISLTKENEWYCMFLDTAYLREKEQLQNLVDPLTFDLIYDLETSSCTLCPILNNYNDIGQRSFRAEVGFVKLCGNDKICQPDLSIKGEVKFGDGSQKELLIGGVKEIIVRVEVENKAQDAAYPGKVIVTYPSVIDYVSSQEVSCSTEAGNDGKRKAECTVGNPFKGNQKKQFDIIFNTQRVTGNITEFIIHLEASSGLTKDQDPSNNEYTLPVAVKFEADLNIIGKSRPDQVVYSDQVTEAVENANDIGPTVKQTITVRNNGPSPMEYSEVTILVPFKYNKEEDSNYLLYLMEVQVLGNAGSCNVKTNYKSLQLTGSTNSSEQVGQESSSSADKSRRDVEKSSVELPCESDSDMTCLKIPCFLGRLRRGDQVKIQMISRLWQNTLIKAKAGSVNLTTTAEVTPLSSVSDPNENDNVVKIVLRANPKTTPKPEGRKVAAWIIIVSVLGGLLLFGLAGFALYRFGFFKRKRHNKDEDNEEEMTPMRTTTALT